MFSENLLTLMGRWLSKLALSSLSTCDFSFSHTLDWKKSFEV